MSIGYVDLSRTRYLRNHYEIYDYRKDRVLEENTLAEGRRQRELELEARQQERKAALESLIEANRTYSSSSKMTQQIEEDMAAKRKEKEAERERRAKQEAARAEAEKDKSRFDARRNFRARQTTTSEDRLSRAEKQAAYNNVERDRRRKEREAREIAKSGISLDSDDEKSTSRSGARSSANGKSHVRATSRSDRLVSKYRDTPTSSSRRRADRGAESRSPAPASPHSRQSSSTPDAAPQEE